MGGGGPEGRALGQQRVLTFLKFLDQPPLSLSEGNRTNSRPDNIPCQPPRLKRPTVTRTSYVRDTRDFNRNVTPGTRQPGCQLRQEPEQSPHTVGAAGQWSRSTHQDPRTSEQPGALPPNSAVSEGADRRCTGCGGSQLHHCDGLTVGRGVHRAPCLYRWDRRAAHPPHRHSCHRGRQHPQELGHGDPVTATLPTCTTRRPAAGTAQGLEDRELAAELSSSTVQSHTHLYV